jgi:hypothetical protein
LFKDLIVCPRIGAPEIRKGHKVNKIGILLEEHEENNKN